MRDSALRLLARREYSVHVLQEKLQKRFPDRTAEIEALLTEFREKKLISDERFCEAFVQDQILRTHSGPVKILQKLKQKGIDPDLARATLEHVFPRAEQQNIARALAQQKYEEIRRNGKAKNKFEARQRVQRFLLGKGFAWDEIRDLALEN